MPLRKLRSSINDTIFPTPMKSHEKLRTVPPLLGELGEKMFRLIFQQKFTLNREV